MTRGHSWAHDVLSDSTSAMVGAACSNSSSISRAVSIATLPFSMRLDPVGYRIGEDHVASRVRSCVRAVLFMVTRQGPATGEPGRCR